MKRKKSKNKAQKMNINPVAVGVAGAAVGAGVAVAATVALNDKKTRQKVDKALKTVKKQASQYVETIKKDNVKEGKKALGKVVASAKKQIQSTRSKKAISAKGGKKTTLRPASHA